MRFIFLFSTLLFWFPLSSYSQQIIGWGEQARLSAEGIELQAKIDTGADNSSIHYIEKEYFDKEGERWVRLKIIDDSNKVYQLSRKLVRTTQIKRHNGNSQMRDVIEMGICIGSVYKTVEVNLMDRTGLQYKLLIGRSFLESSFLIDSGKKNMTRPSCPAN